MQQATISKTFDSYDHYTETYYASSNAVAASAERIYLFIKEYITYLSLKHYKYEQKKWFGQ